MRMTPSKQAIRFFISVLLNPGSKQYRRSTEFMAAQTLTRPSPGLLTGRGQGRSCRAGREIISRQSLRDEAVHVHSRRSAPPCTFHVQVSFSQPSLCAAIGALALCARNIRREYPAQFTCSSVTVKVIHRCISFPFSCGAEALCPGPFAIAARGDQEVGRMFNE